MTDRHTAGEDIAEHLERHCPECPDPHACAYRAELARSTRSVTMYRCRGVSKPADSIPARDPRDR